MLGLQRRKNDVKNGFCFIIGTLLHAYTHHWRIDIRHKKSEVRIGLVFAKKKKGMGKK